MPSSRPLLRKTHVTTDRPPFERIALVLQGGGALGAYQGGVYQALAEPIQSMGHKRSLLQKVSQKFCGQSKSQPPRCQYLDWSNAGGHVWFTTQTTVISAGTLAGITARITINLLAQHS